MSVGSSDLVSDVDVASPVSAAVVGIATDVSFAVICKKITISST
jgi:hypothetical protein